MTDDAPAAVAIPHPYTAEDIRCRRARIARAPREGDTLTFTEALPGLAAVWTMRVMRVVPASVHGPIGAPLLVHTETWGRSGLIFYGKWFRWQWDEKVRRAHTTREAG